MIWFDPDCNKMMHSAKGDYAVLLKLDKNFEIKRQKGKDWAYCMMGMYEDLYDEDKTWIENDQSAYKFCDMTRTGEDNFYWMVTEFYKNNPVPGLRICTQDECESMRDISNEEK